MRHILLLSLLISMVGCSSQHKAKEVETELTKRERVNGGESVGLNKDGEMVLQRKVDLAEELRQLQVDVHELEDRVYGNQKYGSSGLYGVLKKCRKSRSNKANGGTGKLIWTEKPDRVTNKEDEMKIGLDERDQLVAVKEEYLLDRIQRYKKYKRQLSTREEDFKDKVDVCEAALKSQIYDMKQKSQTN